MVFASIFLNTLILLGGTHMGKKGHDLSKSLRQELVLSIVESYAGNEGISTSEVYEIMDNKCPGVNRRTILRDLVELSSRFPLYDESTDGKSKWFLNRDMKDISEVNIYREYLRKELVEFFRKTMIKKEMEEVL